VFGFDSYEVAETPVFITENLNLFECQDPDLNRGHEDFQSSALPTELSRQAILFIVLN